MLARVVGNRERCLFVKGGGVLKKVRTGIRHL